MSSVNVSIFSRSYNVACSPGEEDKLNDAAAMFNDELMRLKQAVSGEVEFEKLVVIAGINMCARHRKVLQTYTADMKTVMDNNIELAALLADLPQPMFLEEGGESASGTAAINDQQAPQPEGLQQEAAEIVIEDVDDPEDDISEFFEDDEDDTAV